MKGRLLIVVAVFAVVAGCDRTITHGADGAPEWERRLADAVPIGLTADSARAVMIRNGFQCRLGADSVRYIWCDKWGGGRFSIVRRRWQAVLNVDDRGRIFERRATTGLTGP